MRSSYDIKSSEVPRVVPDFLEERAFLFWGDYLTGTVIVDCFATPPLAGG